VPQFTTNADRMDPYKNFKFVVVWDGAPVAGVSKVGALTRSTQVVSHREGGDPPPQFPEIARTDRLRPHHPGAGSDP
jgi:hypothetical protein